MKRMLSCFALLMLFCLPVCGRALMRFERCEDVVVYIRACALESDAPIRFEMPRSEFERMNASPGFSGFPALTSHMNACVYTYSVSHDGWMDVTIEGAFRPGFRMAQAYRRGDLSTLSPREKEALSLAVSVCEEICRIYPDAWSRELAVHDYLVRRISYDAGGSGEDVPERTATCALLEGRANCQGYSDAFYLLGTLCGLNVRVQGGVAAGGEHCWNVIELDGSWYIVDLTFDDGIEQSEGKDAVSYIYFNIGRDMAQGTYHWFPINEAADVCAQTGRHNYFFMQDGLVFEDMDSMTRTLYQRRSDGNTQPQWVMLRGGARAFDDAALEKSFSRTFSSHSGSIGYSYVTKTLGENVILYVRFTVF